MGPRARPLGLQHGAVVNAYHAHPPPVGARGAAARSASRHPRRQQRKLLAGGDIGQRCPGTTSPAKRRVPDACSTRRRARAVMHSLAPRGDRYIHGPFGRSLRLSLPHSLVLQVATRLLVAVSPVPETMSADSLLLVRSRARRQRARRRVAGSEQRRPRRQARHHSSLDRLHSISAGPRPAAILCAKER
jgi:hypothetical protein